mmetsp:Transcript_20808/g.70850  ORF Transcript_20808/g.70850 Transcript_20808/m.70850 type:complete len:184 (+) Transcript_20808:202-753(+)|eukprot:CAMPEP_0183808876 /NCGR_PEP_ID=MMETSP0803_2-20130417/44440_1 /TAXON_ID=195967 /ORGANISM="Crustomastix stigmata, Strain CCMP3273" /LENGTH=183 /DNA_ID=CAMNT_0026053681 /DNA_START=170 /DNA_END=721 /DNA_ORIENTATION=+
MIKLFSVKEKQQKEAAAAAATGKPKQTPGELRIAKDISELNLPAGYSIHFPDGKDKLMRFEVTVKPDEGFYLGGQFMFSFDVPATYPHEPPKVKCHTLCYHPNIDLEGNVCLNILREDWKPVLSVNAIVHGLSFLFLDPNPHDPLNKEAAQVLKESPSQFEANVRRSMQGGVVGGVRFPYALA